MLRKASRLHHSVFTGTPTSRRVFQFGTLSHFPLPDGRAAVVVSKKVAASAVVRNKIRRRVLHALKHIPIWKGAYAIYPSKKALQASFSELTRALAEACLSR